MTEAEWWACDDPRHMLGFLGKSGSDRKLRLFACAYARTGSWLIGMSAWCGGDLRRRCVFFISKKSFTPMPVCP